MASLMTSSSSSSRSMIVRFRFGFSGEENVETPEGESAVSESSDMLYEIRSLWRKCLSVILILNLGGETQGRTSFRGRDFGEKEASSSDALILLDSLILGLHLESSDRAECGGLEDGSVYG